MEIDSNDFLDWTQDYYYDFYGFNEYCHKKIDPPLSLPRVSTRSVTTIFMEKFSKLNTVCNSQELFPQNIIGICGCFSD